MDHRLSLAGNEVKSRQRPKFGEKPPRLASRILYRLIEDGIRYGAIGDLEEDFADWVREKGRCRAVLLYWAMIFVLLPGYTRNWIQWRLDMFKNSVKVAFRHFQKHRGFTLLNLSGLTIGLTFAIFLLLYVRYESSYDRWHADYQNIYRIVQWQPNEEGGYVSATVQGPLAPCLKDEYPEVISATRLRVVGNILFTQGERSFLENGICFASPEIFDVFSFELLDGDPSICLANPASIVLSESMALKYFGDSNPIGKPLRMGRAGSVMEVTGVYKDIPGNSHFVMDFIVPFCVYADLRRNDLNRWTPNWFCYTYCRIQDGTDIKVFEAKIQTLIQKYEEDRDQEMKFLLQPLSSIHLFSHVGHEIGRNNDIKAVLIVASIGFAMLLIACMNYINLSTAGSMQKSREIGLRKVVGATRAELARQLFCESVVITAAAFGFAMVLVWMFLPYFGVLIDQEIRLKGVFNLPTMIWLFILMIGTSLVSGSYPALILSSMKSVCIFGHGFAGRSRSMFRNVLVVFQFGISILLILCTLIIADQQDFIHSKDMGYAKDHILVVYLRDGNARRNTQTIKTELVKHPNILEVASSTALPNRIFNWDGLNWPGRGDASTFPYYYAGVDFEFLNLYGIDVVDGRPFSREFPSDRKGAFLLNETAIKKTQWETPIGRELIHSSSQTGKIVGILRDFHFQSIHNPVAPLLLYLSQNTADHGYLSVKIRPEGIQETIAFLRERIDHFSPRYPFEYQFFNEVFDKAYRAEQRMGRIFTIFSVLTILIACLGLYGLASFTAERKTKEIGIRKVLGASVSGICYMILCRYIRWILIAAMLAWPVGYMVMNAWLLHFAYRVPMRVSVFLHSGALVLAIAVLSMSYQTVKAASTNPGATLRYE